MIDPLEAVIAYLERVADLNLLTSGRISPKHRFGAKNGWASPAKALQVRYDGGIPELYVETQRLRLEARCYGENLYEAGKVYRRLVAISREFERELVETSEEGTALVHFLNLSSGPSVLYDPDVEMDAILVFLEVAVSEEAVA